MASPEEHLVSIAGRGAVGAAEKLLARGCDINALCGDHVPLTAAAMNENLAMLQLLILKGCDINRKDLQGRTALNWAVLHDSIENARLLLWSGARTDLHSSAHHPVIIEACTYGAPHNFEMVELLIEAGCNVNYKTADGSTALHCCAYQGNDRCVKLLLAAGANINEADGWKHTALIYAVSEQKHSISQLLLDAGCCVNWRDSGGRTALHYAVRRNQCITTSSLLMHGADPNIQDGDSNIPLIEATFFNFIDIVRLLILANCDVNIKGLCHKVQSRPVSAWDIGVHRQNHLILQLLYAAGGLPKSSKLCDHRTAGMLTVVNNKPLLEWLVEVLHNPMPLKHLCRCNLRRILGLEMKDKLEKMAIPCGLKAFLMFTGDRLFSPTDDGQRFEIVLH